MTIAETTAFTRIDNWLAEHGDRLISIRRNLHAHPEVSGDEHWTTDYIAEKLEIAGLSPARLSVGTGLICDIDPEAGPTAKRFALRADIDALAMDDEKDVPYRSQIPGVCHSCGHDVHSTIMLGLALFYARNRDAMPGSLRFIFQPSEELMPGGATDVLADNGLDGVDGIMAVHTDPTLEVGRIGLRVGAITSASDSCVIEMHGPGGHTARPEETVNMIAVAAHVISELPRRVSNVLGGDEFVRLVFGAIRSGDAGNVIPTKCVLKASVRSRRSDLWEELPSIVEDELAHLLDGTGAEYSLSYTSGVPPVINNEPIIHALRDAAHSMWGVDSVVEAPESWGGDDFAYLCRDITSAYVRLGVRNLERHNPPHALHAGLFDVDEAAIAHAVRLIARLIPAHFADYR